MKPIIVTIGDLHFGNKGHSISAFEQQMKFIEEQMFPYILENSIGNVIQLGDTFHYRDKIDWYIQNELKKRFFAWFDNNGIEYHTLIGNHDTYYKNTLEQNSLTETTKNFKNIFVYTEPTKIQIGKYTIGMNPWIIDYKNPNLTKKVDIMCGHFDIKDYQMMKGISSKEGLDHSQFANSKLVLSGHYHSRTIKDNVHMIGTPYQLSWNDFNESKGFLVIDDNFNYEYVQNDVCPKYVKLYYDNGNISVLGLDYTDIPKQITREQSIDIVKENYCRLFTKSVDNQIDLDSYHVSLLAVSFCDYKIDIVSLSDIIELHDDEMFNESFENNESTIQLIINSIQGMTFDTNIDKDLLIELSKQEYKEAHIECLGLGD